VLPLAELESPGHCCLVICVAWLGGRNSGRRRRGPSAGRAELCPAPGASAAPCTASAAPRRVGVISNQAVVWLFCYRNFSLNLVPFAVLGGPPAAPGAEQGEAGRQQQGHRAAGESLLPSLGRSQWERYWVLINRGTWPGRGGARGEGWSSNAVSFHRAALPVERKAKGRGR